MDNLAEVLGEELANQVTEKLSGKKLMVDSNFVPISRFNDINSQKIALEDMVSQLNTNIDSLKSKDLDIQKVIDERDKIKSDFENRLINERVNHSLEVELIKVGARNNKAVLSLLDMDKIKLSDTGVVGLSEQLESLKTTDAYLFEGKKVINSDNSKVVSPPPKENPFKTNNYYEQVKLKKENPALFFQLAKEAGVDF